MPPSRRLRSALGPLATVAALALAIGSSPVTAAGGRSIGPLALGFPAGDDWEPAIAADRRRSLRPRLRPVDPLRRRSGLPGLRQPPHGAPGFGRRRADLVDPPAARPLGRAPG